MNNDQLSSGVQFSQLPLDISEDMKLYLLDLQRIIRQRLSGEVWFDSTLHVSAIKFEVIETMVEEGLLFWNDTDGTLNLGMPGGVVNLQIGQEMLIRVTNGLGVQIDNGQPVYISGASGSNIIVGLADADFATGVGFRTIAVATEDIAASQKGYVTTQGFVRDFDTDSFVAEGMPLYLAVGGGFSTTTPTAPDITVLCGIVTRKHATEGSMYVKIISLPNLNSLSDVNSSGIADQNILGWNSSTDTWTPKVATSHTQVSFSMYDAEPARSSETSLDGAFLLLTPGTAASPTATQLGPATPANDVSVSKGTGKIVVVVVAGSDVVGDITVTGTSVDRDTGATTGADTDTLTIDAVTTDNSDIDTNTNVRHAFTGAYITSKWFVGTVVLSTTTLNCTIYAYHVSFEQFDDTADITLDTFDANILTTSVNAEFDAYLYSIEVTGDKCNITREASLNIGADGETALANKYWRLRRGNINKAINGTTDGVWTDIHYSNSPAFVEDVSIKVWATEVVPLTLT